MWTQENAAKLGKKLSRAEQLKAAQDKKRKEKEPPKTLVTRGEAAQ